MKIQYFVIFFLIIFSISSCSVYRNRGKIESNKDIKTEKKEIEYTYSFFEGNKQKMLGNLNESGAYFLRCIQLFPDRAAANYEFAGILALSEDYTRAIKFAKKAYDIDPNNKWYEALLISMYKSSGDLKESSLLLEDMLQKHPDDYNSYLELTDTYLKLNKSKNALETLDKFEKKYGFSEALMVEKNRIHISKGDYASARLEVQKMINLEPKKPTYYLLLADLYAEEGKQEKAFGIYQDILKKDSTNGKVHLSLSQYYLEKGNEKKAFDELEKTIRSNEVDLDLKIKLVFSYVGIKNSSNEEKKQVYKLVHILLEKYPSEMKVHSVYSDILVKDKQYKTAKKELLIITKNTPNNYSVWEQLLYLDNQIGDYKSLYQNSTKMLEYFPNKAIAYFFSGLAAYQIKKYDKAAEVLENGIDFAINDTTLSAQFYTMLGDTYHKLKKNKKSDAAYEKSIALNPTNYYVHNNYSYYLSVRAENLARAQTLMEECIKAHPKNGTYLDTYAWVLYMSKDYKKALSVIEQAYTNGGKNNSIIVEHYGDILFMNNNKKEAIEKWKDAEELGNESKLLHKKIIEQNINIIDVKPDSNGNK